MCAMKTFAWVCFVTGVTASWVTLSPSSTPVNSYNALARPVHTANGSIWCVEDGFYWMNTRQMWKFEYQTQRWLWMADTNLIDPVKAHWTLGNTLYAFTNNLWRYNHSVRTWQSHTERNVAPTMQGDVVAWSDPATEALFLYTSQGLSKFELVGNIWVTIMTITDNQVARFVGSHGLIYTGDDLRQWDHAHGWIVMPLQETLPTLVQMWRTAENTAYGLTQMGELWKLDVETGQAHSLGSQGFFNRANFSTCDHDMVIFGGESTLNDVVRFGTVHKTLSDYGPVLIVSGATLAIGALCFIILITLCVVICYQQWRKRRTQLGPFVSHPHNVDFL